MRALLGHWLRRLLAASVVSGLPVTICDAQDQYNANTNPPPGRDSFNVNTGFGGDGPQLLLLPDMPPDAYCNTPDCYKGTTAQQLIRKFSSKFADDMVQHGPHEEWPLRNDLSAAGPNFGPRSATARA